MQNITWLVIANAAKAAVYAVEKREYALAHELAHPESRLRTQELVGDKSGSYRGGSTGRGQFAAAADPHAEEHKNFAKQLSDFLKGHQERQHYQKIILCAEPRFYGLLNQVLSPSVKDAVVKTIQKDYVPLPQPKLNGIIEEIIHTRF